MRTIPGVTALVLVVAALTIMMFRTWTMIWMAPPDAEPLLTQHRWFDLTIVGYGNFLPLLCLMLTFLSIGFLFKAVLVQQFSAAAMLLPGAVALLLSFFGYSGLLAGRLSGPGLAIPPILGIAVAIMLTEDSLQKRASSSATS